MAAATSRDGERYLRVPSSPQRPHKLRLLTQVSSVPTDPTSTEGCDSIHKQSQTTHIGHPRVWCTRFPGIFYPRRVKILIGSQIFGNISSEPSAFFRRANTCSRATLRSDSRDTERWEVLPLLLTIHSFRRREASNEGRVRVHPRIGSSAKARIDRFLESLPGAPHVPTVVRYTARQTPKGNKSDVYLTRFFEIHPAARSNTRAFPTTTTLSHRFIPAPQNYAAPSRRLRASEVLGSKRSLGKGHA